VAAWSSSDLDTICTKIWDAYNAAYVTIASQHWAIGGVVGQDLTSVTGNTGEGGTLTPGTDTGADISQGSSAVITWRIPRHYRGGHPRTYMAGLTANAIDTAVNLATAYQTALVTFAEALMSQVGAAILDRTGTPQLVTVHRVVNKVTLSVPIVDAIQGLVVGDIIRSQRRRLPR
jgi:hypothetical protein